MTRRYLFGTGLETSPLLESLNQLLNGAKPAPISDWYVGTYTNAYGVDRHRLTRARKTFRALLETHDFVNILNLAWSHTGETNRELLATNALWLGEDGAERFNMMKYTQLRNIVEMSLYMAAEDWPPETFPRQFWPTTMEQLIALTKLTESTAGEENV